jgi:hypothetical protein
MSGKHGDFSSQDCQRNWRLWRQLGKMLFQSIVRYSFRFQRTATVRNITQCLRSAGSYFRISHCSWAQRRSEQKEQLKYDYIDKITTVTNLFGFSKQSTILSWNAKRDFCGKETKPSDHKITEICWNVEWGLVAKIWSPDSQCESWERWGTLRELNSQVVSPVLRLLLDLTCLCRSVRSRNRFGPETRSVYLQSTTEWCSVSQITDGRKQMNNPPTPYRLSTISSFVQTSFHKQIFSPNSQFNERIPIFLCKVFWNIYQLFGAKLWCFRCPLQMI